MTVADALKHSEEMRETKSELAIHAAFWLAGLIVVGVLLPSVSNIVVRAVVPRPSTQRVVVVYPEQWNRGDFRNCIIGPQEVIHHLPTLREITGLQELSRQANPTPEKQVRLVHDRVPAQDRLLSVLIKCGGPDEVFQIAVCSESVI